MLETEDNYSQLYGLATALNSPDNGTGIGLIKLPYDLNEKKRGRREMVSRLVRAGDCGGGK